MFIRKFVALEPISKADCKSNNHQCRISVACSGKDAASRNVETLDLMNLAIPVYNSSFRRIRHSGRPRRVIMVDKLGTPIGILKQMIFAERSLKTGATQF